MLLYHFCFNFIPFVGTGHANFDFNWCSVLAESFEKGSNGQNYPMEKFSSPSKIYDSPILIHPLCYLKRALFRLESYHHSKCLNLWPTMFGKTFLKSRCSKTSSALILSVYLWVKILYQGLRWTVCATKFFFLHILISPWKKNFFFVLTSNLSVRRGLTDNLSVRRGLSDSLSVRRGLTENLSVRSHLTDNLSVKGV